MTLLDKNTVVSLFVISLIILLGLLDPLPVNITYAQQSTHKIAVIFDEVHIYSSHTAIGCANWNLLGFSFYSEPPLTRSLLTTILDYCVDEGNTYRTIPTTALVEEFAPGERRTIGSYGTNELWFGGTEQLGRVYLALYSPPEIWTRLTEHSIGDNEGDYSLTFSVLNCRHPILFVTHLLTGGLCALPPGEYYRDDRQSSWTRGVPPDPDLGGCGWPCFP